MSMELDLRVGKTSRLEEIDLDFTKGVASL